MPSPQTQPVPNPISYYLHQSPPLLHQLETLSNHAVELVAPFLLFLPRPFRLLGGLTQILFQVWLPAVASFHLLIVDLLFGSVFR